jgi:hypothetical protein
MKFSLVFDQSGDSIEFDVIHNREIFEYFVNQSDKNVCNSFSDDSVVGDTVTKLLNELHNAVSLTNTMSQKLCGVKFAENNDRVDYLDQKFLNRQHEQWVLSQYQEIDIDVLRFSHNKDASELGWTLHDHYPDHIRKIRLAEAMIKLGYIFPYEEVNLTVHRLESYFASNIEFKSDLKWQVFDNPFQSTMISNNDRVNFSFGYTYVGRQYYNKWQYFDTDLECIDHYNYETLEYAFQVNLDRPQTIPYSKEFLDWCRSRGLPSISTQIPIANAVDLEHNLKHYRTILYKNSLSGNRASIKIH